MVGSPSVGFQALETNMRPLRPVRLDRRRVDSGGANRASGGMCGGIAAGGMQGRGSHRHLQGKQRGP